MNEHLDFDQSQFYPSFKSSAVESGGRAQARTAASNIVLVSSWPYSVAKLESFWRTVAISRMFLSSLLGLCFLGQNI